MTVSGVTSYSPAFITLARQSLFYAGAIGDSEEPTGDMYDRCFIAANSLIKAWQAMDIHVWTQEEAILFLQYAQVRYVIGGDDEDAVACDANAYVWTQLTANLDEGDTTVSVTTSTGFDAGDNVGIALASGATFWTTIAAHVDSTTFTLTDALPSAASAGNSAWSFPEAARIVRPLLVPNCRRLQWGVGQSGQVQTPPLTFTLTPLTVLSRQEYMDLPNPANFGTPNQVFYSPQRDWGELYVWQPVNNATWALRFTWYRPLETYLLSTNTSDFPDEWTNPLIWNIAWEIAPGYGVDQATYQRLDEKASFYRDMVQGWDRESQPVLFGITWTGRGRM